MKEKTTREDAESSIIKDSFFDKGKYRIKIFQSLFAIIGWVGVFFPFLWIALPFIFPRKMGKLQILIYFEEKESFNFLLLFLSIAFFTIAILYVVLTYLNNSRFSNDFTKKEYYNEVRLKEREKLLESAYEKRFGPRKERQSIKYYSVLEEQNLPTDFTKKLYDEVSE